MSEPPIVRPPAQGRKTEEQSLLARGLNHRGLVLALLFFVTAALGLPVLWKSPAFSPREKIVWSVIVTIYTAVILWLFARVMWWSYTRIQDALGPMY